MTRKEIISRLGWLNLRHIDDSHDSILSRIERLVAEAEAAEREACAKHFERLSGSKWFADNVADEIRARSKA